MNLPEFLNVIFNGVLFFKRANGLVDKNECIVTSMAKDTFCDKLIATFPKIDKPGAEEIIDILNNKISGKMKESNFIECWSYRRDDYALWKIYANNFGISIGTRINKLISQINVIRGNSILVYDRVTYSDSLDDFVNEKLDIAELLINLQFNKLKAYSFEDEFRIIFVDEDNALTNPHIIISSEGLCISINPEIIIQEIFFSPFMPLWFKRLLKEIINQKYPSLLNRIVDSTISE